jgi:ribosomal protein S18 acetylase RimI-like enzyme
MDKNDIIIEQVKQFSSEIADAIRKFAPQFGQNYQLFTDDSLKEMVNSPQCYIFIARYQPTKQIAGMIMENVYRTFYIRKAYVEELFVDGDFRKMGIGTKLMQKVVENAKKNNAAYVDFTSKPDRIEGNSLYAKLGFKKRETNVYRLTFDYGEV